MVLFYQLYLLRTTVVQERGEKKVKYAYKCATY